jgi:hypothetical protein
MSQQKWWMTSIVGCLVLSWTGIAALANPGVNGPKGGTVLIIRHAEKPDDDSNPLLSDLGGQRAQKYVEYFKHLMIDGHSATPVFVFATKDSKNSDRPWLTVKPLVDALKLPHDHSIKKDDFSQVVSQLKGGGYDDKIVLICWHHGNIPGILDALGANHHALLDGDKWPGKPPKDVFGWLVELEFDSNGALKSSVILNEHLMDDDTIDPPSSK